MSRGDVVTRSDASLPGAGIELEAIFFSTPSPRAAVVLLHGWGGRAEDLVPTATALAAEGYLAVSVSMRGWGGSGGTDDCGLRQPDDVAVAVQWLQSRFDAAGQMGLLGISQGGQVALLTAARSTAVSAVAAWAPVTDVASWRATTDHPGIPEYIDAACADGDLVRRSPIASVDGIEVPVLLIHGDADTRVPTEQSLALHRALEARGHEVRLELLVGVGHQRDPSCLPLTSRFFSEVL